MGIDKDFLLWIMENPGNKYVMFRIAEFDKFESILSEFVCRKDDSLVSLKNKVAAVIKATGK